MDLVSGHEPAQGQQCGFRNHCLLDRTWQPQQGKQGGKEESHSGKEPLRNPTLRDMSRGDAQGASEAAAATVKGKSEAWH